MSFDWKGPYRVVTKEAIPAAGWKSFVVTEREDPMLAANADNHLQIVEKILSHNGRKEEPHNLTFEVKFLGDPKAEIKLLALRITLHVFQHSL